MPQCFVDTFGKKVAVIVDCFELFCETPSGMFNDSLTYSNYKNHHTIKYLIGIAPQGVITFISKGWGGRVSDKHITEKCDILEQFLPGDILMADRGFNIREDVSFYQAELIIPSFTKGKNSCTPWKLKVLANCFSKDSC